MCYIYSIYPWIKCFIYILQIRKPNQDFKKVSQVIISQTAVQVGTRTQNHLTSACGLNSLPKGDEFITSGACIWSITSVCSKNHQAFQSYEQRTEKQKKREVKFLKAFQWPSGDSDRTSHNCFENQWLRFTEHLYVSFILSSNMY